MTQARVNSLDILLVFCLGFLPPLYLNTVYRYKCNQILVSSLWGFFHFYLYNLPGYCLRPGIQPETTSLIPLWGFPFLPQRTGTRSKYTQNPWGVDVTLAPNHRRRLHDAVGFSFFTTTNRWYTWVLHDAFAPITYRLVYMTQWVFLFYHDKQTNTHGYYIHGFHFFPTTT